MSALQTSSIEHSWCVSKMSCTLWWLLQSDCPLTPSFQFLRFSKFWLDHAPLATALVRINFFFTSSCLGCVSTLKVFPILHVLCICLFPLSSQIFEQRKYSHIYLYILGTSQSLVDSGHLMKLPTLKWLDAEILGDTLPSPPQRNFPLSKPPKGTYTGLA